MFPRSLRPVCQLCRISCPKKQSSYLSLRHATRNRRICSGQKLQTYSQQKNSFIPLSCFSTTNTLWKEKGRKPGHDGHEDEALIINKLMEDEQHEDDALHETEEYKQVVQEEFHYDGVHHSLMIIHPAIRWEQGRPSPTTPELQLNEACALVHSLPQWKVAATKIIKVKSHGGFIFMKGQLKELTDLVKSQKNISAVFVNVDILKINQVAMLQGAWQLPVFDRYTLVLHIFREYAHTREAKLQIALAEIPYIRGRLEQINEGQHDHVTGKMHYVVSGGFRFTYIQKRHALVAERERRLRGELEKVRQQREVLRQNRIKLHYPTVAVVGYTNCGCSSLCQGF